MTAQEKKQQDLWAKCLYILKHGSREMKNNLDLGVTDVLESTELKKMGCKVAGYGSVTTLQVVRPKNADKKLLARVARWQQRHVKVAARFAELERERRSLPA
jgi:hypothetical protein